MNKVVAILALLFAPQRFIHRSEHINPSAETLKILSPDMKVIAELDGWELSTLPNETVIYHRSQVHFAATHSLEIAVYDPVRRKDKLIYPPMPIQPVRRSSSTGCSKSTSSAASSGFENTTITWIPPGLTARWWAM